MSRLPFAPCALAALLACAPSRPALRPAAPGPELSRGQRLAAAAEALTPELTALVEKTRAPGVVLGLVVDGELVWVKGWGAREVASGAPVTPDTVFRIASMTKAFTADAVLKLRDEGRLALDAPLETYLPELTGMSGPTRDAPRPTLRLLLSHSAGLPEDNACGDLRLPMPEAELDAVLRRGLSFSTTPGTEFEYANLGFALAGRVVSRVTGQSAQQYISRQLLQPLGMSSTVWDVGQVPSERRAHGYGRRDSPMPSSGLAHFEDDLPHEELTLEDGSWAPMGGLWTSPRDYARWVAYQLDAWPPRDDPEAGPVRRASVREAQQVQRFIGFTASTREGALKAQSVGYGFGWAASQSCTFGQVVTHTGGLPGYGSHVRLLPNARVGAFAMTNLTYQGANGVVVALLEGLARQALLDPPRLPPTPALTDSAQRVLELLSRWDPAALEAAVDHTYLVYQPLDRVQARLASLSAQLGQCGAPRRWTVENRLRGDAVVHCERGTLAMHLELTHEVPTRLQALDLVVRPTLVPATRTMVEALLSGAKEGTAVGRLQARRGPCRVEEAWASEDGKALSAHLACARGTAELTVGLEGAGGTPKRVEVEEPDGGRCLEGR
ncbi:MAG: beta-lactamase family protein [Deltaproteobacteria bacterium]|nr:beta-lactamase family protein [Deltaproteobacteria bacterium]